MVPPLVSSSSQALLVKIVTEIFFGQCTFSKSNQTTVLAADHRPAHEKKTETQTTRMQWAHVMGATMLYQWGVTDLTVD